MDKGFHIINIAFIYRGAKIRVAISRTKLLTALKDKAYKLFFPIKGRIILSYLGKDLTPQEGMQIGHVFKDKKNVTLIIEVQQWLTHELNSHQTPKRILDNTHSTSQLKIKSDKANTPLGFTHQISSYTNIIPMKIKSSKGLLCFECCEKEILFYCRDCNIFLCSICRCLKKYKHYNHSIIDIDPKELKSSANKYKEVLVNNMNSVKEDYVKVNQTIESKTDTLYWRKKLGQKIDQFCSLTNELNDFVPKVDMRNISSNIVHSMQFDKEHERMSKILEGIVCSDRSDPFGLFEQINKSEKDINTLFIDVCLLEQYTIVQNKINSYYRSIEDEIDALITKSINKR